MSKARVISQYKGAYKIREESGREYLAKVTGKRMYEASGRKDYPAVGDWVNVTVADKENAVIDEILPRHSILKRKRGEESQILATNIDVAFVVQSVDRDYSLNRFERYFAIAKDGGVSPAVVLNKVDLLSEEDLRERMAELNARFPDISIIFTTAEREKGLEELKKNIENGKTYCFLGSSGVGKSSIINKLLGNDAIKTREISAYSDRGKHTTTGRQMYFLAGGGMVIDTPGIREVGMTDTGKGVDAFFDEITALSKECRYSDCSHTHENGCAVVESVKSGELNEEKYSNYLNLKKETEFYEMGEMEKKEKDRKFGKLKKNAVKDLKRLKNLI